MKNMKKNNINITLIYLLLSWIVVFTGTAQNKNERKVKQSKKNSIEVKSVVVNSEGQPIINVQIIAGEGAVILFTNAKGEFNTKVASNGTIMVEAFGYKDKVYRLAESIVPRKIVLEKEALFASKESMIGLADGSEITQRNLVGAVSLISGKSLTTYPDLVVSNALQGKAAGLIVRNNVSGLGNNVPSFYIRGLHGNTANEALVIIDGIERPLEDLLPEEIEKIELFKDATTQVLYGSRAANGVLWVTTRRGENNRSFLKVTAEAGVSSMTRLPKYLNSADYAELFNEARANDGLAPFFNQTQLDGYKNSTGVNDLLYPNADYYKEFLNSQSNYKKAVIELNGGNNNVKYAVVAGFTNANGYEKAAESTSLNRFNLRANLDVDVTDYLSLVAGVSGRMEIRNWGAKDGGQTFSALSTLRPNEYPFTISPENLGIPADSSGIPFFGASQNQIANMYADMMYGGNTAERYSNNQTNLGLNFKLDKLTKGLKAGAFITFDNYDYYKEAQIPVNATYSINTYNTVAGVLDTLFTQMQKYAPQTQKLRINAETRRSLGIRGNIGYENQFGKNSINSMLAYNYTKYETQGVGQDVINANYTAHLNYSYDNRYIVELDAAYMGSNRFAPGNKFFLSPAVGASWIISNEEFLKNSESINFLKIKTSYGVLGYDRNTDFLLYQRAWQDQGGTVAFGEQNNGDKPNITSFVRAASPDLKWEQAAQFNIGIEGLFLHHRLGTELNYFNEKRTNIIGFNGASYGDYLGDYVYNTNMGSVDNQGIEGSITWTDYIGDLKYSVSGNFVCSKNKLLSWNSVINPDENYRSNIGKPTDAMFGLQAEGLFGKDVPLAGHAVQTFGPYQDGDIAYKDLNNDGVIDARDVTMLGNSFPRTTFGIDINLQYKGWGLIAYGYAETGISKWTNNSYYWNYGENKYSILALDRYNSISNPMGNYPRLTTISENNFQNSSFWLINTDFFRLKNIELSYTFTNRSVSAVAKQIKIFARGANLFVISTVKDLDPEMLDAGVTNYPVSTNITGGVTFTF